jgi:hypothetical protein
MRMVVDVDEDREVRVRDKVNEVRSVDVAWT